MGATGPHLQLQQRMPTDAVSVTGVGRGAEEWVGRGVAAWWSSLLGLSLGSYSFHGFAHGLFIPEELHGLDGL